MKIRIHLIFYSTCMLEFMIMKLLRELNIYTHSKVISGKRIDVLIRMITEFLKRGTPPPPPPHKKKKTWAYLEHVQ